MIKQEIITTTTTQPLIKYTVDNGNGYAFSCLNFGATLTSITMPDRDGKISNILLGFDNPNDFLHDQTYFFGKAIGRVGGRIGGGTYRIDNSQYTLPKNEGHNTLHGGQNGFHHLWWNASEIENGIIFTRLIDSDVDGFPGKIDVSITYRWDRNNQLHIEFKGKNQSDFGTLFNPTTHNYFNLNHQKTDGLRHHELSILSDKILELGEDLIPTGKLINIDNTAFDFRKGQNLVTMLESVKQWNVDGYDHPYKVTGPQVAILRNTMNGRVVNIHSDRNALIFYSLNFTEPEILVNEKNQLFPHMAIALEPQTLPDAIHHPNFGDIILPAKAEQTYHIRYDLSVED